MNYFFSGVGTFTGELKARLAGECPWRLLSCHGSYLSTAEQWLALTEQHKAAPEIEIMLDSGAFTAWSKGEEVSLDHLLRVYGSFVERYAGKLKALWLINLDRIPGSPGVTAGQAEIAAAVVESDANYKVLVDAFGERVLPVFHQNESRSRLIQLQEMTPYLCVSPRNDLHERFRVKWSREVHGYLSPTTRTHGLATTGASMMASVPWHSVDSASWVMTGALGGVAVNLNGVMKKISVSSDSPNMRETGKHYDNMTPLERAVLDERFERHGFSIETLRVSHGDRMALNMLETIDYMTTHKVKVVDEPTLFSI